MKKKNKVKNILKIVIYTMILLSILIASVVIIHISKTIRSVKNIDLALNDNAIISTIYDKNDIEEADGIKVSKNNIELSSLNEDTINAFISIEDKNFYSHKGLNYKRILKATFNNMKSLSFKEGASTITQQLVKNRYLSNEKTIDRKIKEAYLAIKLEKSESKDKILECYLNTIYFGNGAYGIYDASKTFFDKEPEHLSLSESCILAGVIKAPSLYSPINNYEKSISRRNLILKEMLDDNMITAEEYNNAINEEVILNINILERKNDDCLYNEFAINEACDILKINKNQLAFNGYKIYTYKDSELQKILEKNINESSNYDVNSFGNIADSLSMIISNDNYSVSAIAGKSKYNLYNIKRQPGSLIKPIFTYAPAIEEKEIFLSSKILDEKIEIDNYSPNNVGNKIYGYVGIRDCIADSLNIPAVKLTNELGLEKCKGYASKVGISFDSNDTGLSLALGGMTKGTTLKEITDSYSPFTNNGNYAKSRFVRKITDNNNNIIYEDKLTESKVYSADTAYLMTESMLYAVKNGTSKKLSKLPFDVAGKTGTVAVKGSNLNTDAYSLAYTKDHTMSVWLGNYTMDEKYNLEGHNNGGTFATKIILDTFSMIYDDVQPGNFERPESIVDIVIDSKTLEEDNVVVLGNNVPERYQKVEIFSMSNIPKNTSTKFTTIMPFDIEGKTTKNSIITSFDCEDYIKYDLYRNNKLLTTISNKNENYSYIDSDIEMNKSYEYYVIAYSNYCDKKFTTEKKSFKVIKEYEELLLDDNQTYEWLFS